MLGEMKTETMTQVDAAIKSQLSSVIKEIKHQMKDMFKEMIKEMTTTTNENEYDKQIERNNHDISYEEERDDEELDILSFDEDTDLYIDQETINGRSSLRAHKKKIIQKKEDFVSTKKEIQMIKPKKNQNRNNNQVN